MQRVVLAIVIREYPILMTIPAIACELFENPNDLTGGMALARAVHELVAEELLYSDGFLAVPTRPALHIKRLVEGDSHRV